MREPGFADQLAGGPDSIARQELTDGTIVSTACFTSKSWVLHNAAYNLRRAPHRPSLYLDGRAPAVGFMRLLAGPVIEQHSVSIVHLDGDLLHMPPTLGQVYGRLV